MLLFLLSLFMLCNTSEAKFLIDDSVSIVGGFDSNPIYMDTSQNSDYLFKVDPKLFLIYDTNEITLKIGGWASYDKYSKNQNQTSTAWNLSGKLEARPTESTKIQFYTDYTKNSDPIRLSDESRYQWSSPFLKLNMDYRGLMSSWGFSSGFEAESKNYELVSIKNFNNRKKYISIGGKYYFFPETALIFGIKSGYSTYTADRSSTSYPNN
ncbi:MAG: hypothetical protein WCQ47_03880, partial [bacterium]